MRKITFIFTLICSQALSAIAQEKEYVYKDSTLEATQTTPVQEATAPIEDTVYNNDANDEVEEVKPDTLLYYYPLDIAADTIEVWKNAKSFAYAKYLDSLLREAKNKKKDTPPPIKPSGRSWLEALFTSPILKVIFWILAGVFVLFIVYRLFLADSIFRKNVTKADNVFEAVKEEEITSETDFDAAISLALSQQQYRTAIRYQYLKTLHLLANREWLQLAVDKTNFQYVREIKQFELQNGFSKLTLHYEYVWYGEFAIDAIQYARMEKDFNEYNKKV